jgi:xanthine dehydrogenase YagR molybdenum-binding subunit
MPRSLKSLDGSFAINRLRSATIRRISYRRHAVPDQRGVSFALHEEAHIDPVYGRVVNESLAEYHVTVNADIGTLGVTVLNIPDVKFNLIGSRGIGEVGITGAAAAVANAIYNATGKRIREYPITPDKIMTA